MREVAHQEVSVPLHEPFEHCRRGIVIAGSARIAAMAMSAAELRRIVSLPP
jgi:hypothetical protein